MQNGVGRIYAKEQISKNAKIHKRHQYQRFEPLHERNVIQIDHSKVKSLKNSLERIECEKQRGQIPTNVKV